MNAAIPPNEIEVNAEPDRAKYFSEISQGDGGHYLQWRDGLEALSRILGMFLTVSAIFFGAYCPGLASSPSPEYSIFESVCSVVEFESDNDLKRAIDAESVNRSVASSIEKLLRARNFDFKVNYGRTCFRANEAYPRLLTLWFYTSLAQPKELGSDVVVVSLIVHSFFQDSQRASHEFPTRVFVCPTRSISICLADQVSEYFASRVLPTIDAATPFRNPKHQGAK